MFKNEKKMKKKLKNGSKAGIHKIHDNAGIVKTSVEDSYLITYFFESFGSINQYLEWDFNSVRFGSCSLLFETFGRVFIISESFGRICWSFLGRGLNAQPYK